MAAALRHRAGHHDDMERQSLLAMPRRSMAAAEAVRLRALDDLRDSAGTPFDPSCSEHVGALYSIWSESFPELPFEATSERWKDLGFQGVDPRTDLRGCGITGLVHLERALLSQRAALEEALCGPVTSPESSPLSAFPLAIASINCTAMILSYLHIAPKLAMSFAPGAARVGASHSTLHGFLSLGMIPEEVEDSDVDAEARARVDRLERSLEVMHARLLLRLASLWRQMLDSRCLD